MKIIQMFYLHSSMDRLETNIQTHFLNSLFLFTFQYGQIRNKGMFLVDLKKIKIYIPVWIDQKHITYLATCSLFPHLHSSMDRLETHNNPEFRKDLREFHLHSSMDRLETQELSLMQHLLSRFTFQYGQIRNNYDSDYGDWKY